jgi:hypothetical protein
VLNKVNVRSIDDAMYELFLFTAVAQCGIVEICGDFTQDQCAKCVLLGSLSLTQDQCAKCVLLGSLSLTQDQWVKCVLLGALSLTQDQCA